MAGATPLTLANARIKDETGQDSRVSWTKLKRWAYDGRIPAVKINGEWVVPDEDWPRFREVVTEPAI